MAVSLSAVDLAVELRASDGASDLVEPQLRIFTRLLATVTRLVEDYAPMAPENVQNEAAIRVGAWLYDSTPGRSQADAMDASGARAMLSSYRILRATPII